MWDADLADKAQAWADWMQSNGRMTHSDCYAYPNPLASTSGGTSTGISGTYLASGENLAWAQGSSGITKTCDQYTGEYNQACAVFNWYHEYTDYWTDPSDADLWQSASGMGHFTAMVWKGVEKIGCAQAGAYSDGVYFVCQYGSDRCDQGTSNTDCWNPSPPGLPNFNSYNCATDECVSPYRASQDTCGGSGTATDDGNAPAPTAAGTAPATDSDCVNTDGGATDPYDDGCDDYASTPSWCGNYDDDDFTSNEMCCACASTPAPVVPGPTRRPAATPTPGPMPSPVPAPGTPTVAPMAAPTGYGDGQLGGGDDSLGGDCSSCYSQGTMTGQNGWVADHNYYRRGHSRRHVTLR